MFEIFLLRATFFVLPVRHHPTAESTAGTMQVLLGISRVLSGLDDNDLTFVISAHLPSTLNCKRTKESSTRNKDICRIMCFSYGSLFPVPYLLLPLVDLQIADIKPLTK